MFLKIKFWARARVYVLMMFVVNRMWSYSKWNYGKAVFRGPPEFIETVKDSLELIREKAPEKADAIHNLPLIFFFWSGGPPFGLVGKVCNVHSSFFEWGSKGIATCI